jgi:hypothetical protein
VLDPTTAIIRPKQEIGDTVYVSDRILVRADQLWAPDARVTEVLKSLGLGLRPPKRYRDDKDEREYRDYREYRPIPHRPERSRELGLESQQVVGLELVVVDQAGAPAPDAWTLLQQIRSQASDVAEAFELVHVLFATSGQLSGVGKGGSYIPGIGKGGSYIPGIGKGGSYIPGIGMGPDEFGVPGFGGKAPVAVVVADPSQSAPRLKRPPVVVMPDTGIGEHPWFPDEADVTLTPPPQMSLGVKIVGDPVADRGSGVTARLTGEFDRLAGHGTFIAGLVRQTAPSARLQSHAIMTSDGLVAEDDVLEVLQDLLDEQTKALANNDAGSIIDVLTLSFGCYHEDLADEDSDPSGLTATSFATILRDLGKLGILVIAGAGNDATTRPFLPAAFAGSIATGSGALPLVSVGSLNPDQTKVSLFSNSGTWVTTYRHGAAIISTLPLRQNASSQASADVAGISTLPEDQQVKVGTGEVARPQDRATIDLDDYSSGFGVWSGTSFSAPVLAGQLAKAIGDLGSEATDLGSLQQRGWDALRRVLSPKRLLR